MQYQLGIVPMFVAKLDCMEMLQLKLCFIYKYAIIDYLRGNMVTGGDEVGGDG
jgi:hypothetical protein